MIPNASATTWFDKILKEMKFGGNKLERKCRETGRQIREKWNTRWCELILDDSILDMTLYLGLRFLLIFWWEPKEDPHWTQT